MGAATTTNVSGSPPRARAQVGEWFWRFLAVVMLIVVGWVVWIAIQISPPEIVLPAAYEAAAQGRARNSSGTIGGAPVQLPDQRVAEPKEPEAVSGMAATAPATAAAQPAPPAVAAEPPVNLEKLRRADSIETPIFERARRGARPAPDAAQ